MGQGAITDGHYTHDSEYFRDVIRRDQESRAKLQVLKSAIDEAMASGASKRRLAQIWREAESRRKKKGNG